MGPVEKRRARRAPWGAHAEGSLLTGHSLRGEKVVQAGRDGRVRAPASEEGVPTVGDCVLGE